MVTGLCFFRRTESPAPIEGFKILVGYFLNLRPNLWNGHLLSFLHNELCYCFGECVCAFRDLLRVEAAKFLRKSRGGDSDWLYLQLLHNF